MLYIIGIGLSDEKDISVKGLETVKKCSKIYLENYTSLLQCSLKDLEKFYGKKINSCDRAFTEDGTEILENAKKEDVALLVIGDVFGATTHFGIYSRAKKEGIRVETIHNASIINVISMIGLQLYKFGKVGSIPFRNEKVETPYNILKANKDHHTLLLLDIEAEDKKYMKVSEAIEYLLRVGEAKGEDIFTEETLCVGCARLGSNDFKIKAGKAKDLLRKDFGKPPHCLVIPGKLHFTEEEALELWS